MRPGTTGNGQRPQPRTPRPGSGPRVVVPTEIPVPATPLRCRRRDESNIAPSREHRQIGARNLPQAASWDQRRVRGAVSGESLSARAAATRTPARRLEEAEAAKTSEQLEAVATKLAQLFPARRKIRANANANSRCAAAGWSHTAGSGTAAQPEQQTLWFARRRATPKQEGMYQGGHKHTKVLSGQTETSSQGSSFQRLSLL